MFSTLFHPLNYSAGLRFLPEKTSVFKPNRIPLALYYNKVIHCNISPYKGISRPWIIHLNVEILSLRNR